MLKFLFNLEFLIISHPVDQQNKNFGQKKMKFQTQPLHFVFLPALICFKINLK